MEPVRLRVRLRSIWHGDSACRMASASARMLLEVLAVVGALAFHVAGIEDVLHVTLILLLNRRAWLHYIRGRCGTALLEGLAVFALLYFTVNLGRAWNVAYSIARDEQEGAMEIGRASCRERV